MGHVIKHDGEFSTLFGITVDEFLTVAKQWLKTKASDKMVYLAINGAMNNLLGYPHAYHGRWQDALTVTKDEVRRVYEKWRKLTPKTQFSKKKPRATVPTAMRVNHGKP